MNIALFVAVFVIVFPLFLILFAVGYYIGRYWWREEIDVIMKIKKPHFSALGKFYPYFWERNGHMWYNYLVWTALSALVAILWALRFSLF